MRHYIPVIFLLLIAISQKTISQDARLAKIERLLSQLYEKHLFNGAIVVGQNGKVIFSKGYGYANFHDSIPFTPFSTADGGSNAKTLTAASILILAEQGKLKLSDSIQHYLPNYPYSNTTVWNFITHSLGGLPDYDYFFDNTPATAIVSTTSNLEIIGKNKPPLAYSPNMNFYYDNVGFDLAALVVERVSGKGYYEFLKEKIFQPLRMDSSFVRPARFDDWEPNRTRGYRYKNDSLQDFDVADREGFYGGCNIWFTATDLYKWGESFYYHPVLSKTVLKKTESTVFINGKQSHLRLGAFYEGKTKNAFYYWGNVAGFYSWVYWDTEKKFTIAFMTNTAMPQWARPLLTSALINIMSGSNYLPIIESRADIVNKKNLEQITGVYEVRNVGKVKISLRNSKPVLKVKEGLEYQMHLVDSKTFYIPGFDPWISFYILKGNKFQTINWTSTKFKTTGRRISN